jgi:hypothetical protein
MTETTKTLQVQTSNINILNINGIDYICITDIAKIKNPVEPKDVVKNWMRTKSTIEFLILWERLNNETLKGVDFDPFLKEAGSNSFTMSPSRWIELTNAKGIIVKRGAGGGSYAHKDIAFEFTSWVSSEFKLYLLKEFQRLKEQEQKQFGWNAKRELAKINYHIHTDAIKYNLIPAELTKYQISSIYANEADVLNMALFGKTAQQWRDENPNQKGNIRDYATINELICLSNIENLNALFIQNGLSQQDRLLKLNQMAVQQMKILKDIGNKKFLK